MNAYSPLFMAPTVVITCECGDTYAGYEDGTAVKLKDAMCPEYDELGGVDLGQILHMYYEDPECSGCGGDLKFAAL
ncbi:hypothetical protein [Streptomyces sp. NPDC021969]|uniref:hypothetical protein n=1 Tax=unclassified Streptomyces TaxID=2593676 RepID=UPI0034034708